MTSVLVRMTVVLGMAALAGCSAAEDATATEQTTAAFSDDGAWRAIPLGRGTSVALHATHGYAGALATECGPDYALDVVIDFGPVTKDILEVDAVTASFHPAPGHAVVPRKVDVW